jgi:putative phosphoribosyl transferase
MSPNRRFRDRHDAGRQLARALERYAHQDNTVVLGLPRGGVPVAYEVARALDVPLDVFLVRKLGAPGHEELAMGAIATGGIRVINEQVRSMLRIPDDALARVAAREQEELERRERVYRGDAPAPELRGRTVIVVDDGLATGSTMRAAAQALRVLEPRWLVVAVPVAAPETCDEFRDIVDDVVCVQTPERFQAVGLWYDDFSQTSDDEVRALLREQRSHEGAA